MAVAQTINEESKPKTGLKHRLRAYAEHSSIKCLPKMIRAKSLLHRLLWMSSFIIGTSMAIYLLFGLWSLFFSYAVTLSVSTKEGAKPPFPDVTVCNLNPLWNSGPNWGLLANIEGFPSPLTYDQYIMVLFQSLYASDNDQSGLTTTDMEIYSSSGFLKHTTYDDEMFEGLGKNFIWKCAWESENKQTDCIVNSIITPTNGLCFTLRPPDGHGTNVKTRLEGLSVILFLNNINMRFVADYRLSPFQSFTEGVKVLIHPRGTAPHMAEGFTVAPGNEASVVTSYNKRKLLPHPYGKCDDDIALDLFENIQSAGEWEYTEYACTSLCYQSHIIDQCDCLDSTELTFGALREKYRFCSIYSALDSTPALAEINCTRRVKKNLDEQETCVNTCLSACSRDQYMNSINQVPWPHEIYLLGFYYTYMYTNPPSPEFKFYYEQAIGQSISGNESEAWRLVRSTNLIQRNFLQLSITMSDVINTGEDKPAITVEGIIGNLGGILNLWIGFTFITIMEFVDFFLTVVMDRFWSYNTDEKKNPVRKHPEVTMVEPVNFM